VSDQPPVASWADLVAGHTGFQVGDTHVAAVEAEIDRMLGNPASAQEIRQAVQTLADRQLIGKFCPRASELADVIRGRRARRAQTDYCASDRLAGLKADLRAASTPGEAWAVICRPRRFTCDDNRALQQYADDNGIAYERPDAEAIRRLAGDVASKTTEQRTAER